MVDDSRHQTQQVAACLARHTPMHVSHALPACLTTLVACRFDFVPQAYNYVESNWYNPKANAGILQVSPRWAVCSTECFTGASRWELRELYLHQCSLGLLDDALRPKRES